MESLIDVGEDDFLIATDIDRLIDILSSRKDVEVGSLSRELKMNRKEVEKWLHVLEEEGLVDLTNRMGSLHVVWIMDAPEEEPPVSRRKKAPRAREPQPPKGDSGDDSEDEEEGGQDKPPAGIELAAEIGAMRSVAPPLPKEGEGRFGNSFLSGIFRGKKSRSNPPARAHPKIHFDEDSPHRDYIPPERRQLTAGGEPQAREEDGDFEEGLPASEEEMLLPHRRDSRPHSDSLPEEPPAHSHSHPQPPPPSLSSAEPAEGRARESPPASGHKLSTPYSHLHAHAHTDEPALPHEHLHPDAPADAHADSHPGAHPHSSAPPPSHSTHSLGHPGADIAPEPESRMKKKLEKSEFLRLPRSQTGKLRSRLEDYLQLIREGKRELYSLESEKEKVHREGFLSLEKDFEANLDSIEYALLEKEKRILEAKERFSTLPEKIGTLNEIQESLSGFDSDARNLLSKTKEDLDSRWGRLQEVSEELSGELAKGEKEAMHERGRMMQLRDMLQSIGHAEAQLRETLVSSRSVIEEMEEKVQDVEDSLESLAGSRAFLEERLEGIRTGLEQKMQSLEDLRSQMEKIEEVESWFREYSEDYESKMDELQAYVQESEEELSHIKKAAELEYVKRYLDELDGVESKHRESLGALEMEEASIDEKIDEVRARIKQLMRESSELMSKYRQMAQEGSGFEEMVATARAKTGSHLGTLEEKARERRRFSSSPKLKMANFAPKAAKKRAKSKSKAKPQSKSKSRPKSNSKSRSRPKKPSSRKSGGRSRK